MMADPKLKIKKDRRFSKTPSVHPYVVSDSSSDDNLRKDKTDARDGRPSSEAASWLGLGKDHLRFAWKAGDLPMQDAVSSKHSLVCTCDVQEAIDAIDSSFKTHSLNNFGYFVKCNARTRLVVEGMAVVSIQTGCGISCYGGTEEDKTELKYAAQTCRSLEHTEDDETGERAMENAAADLEMFCHLLIHRLGYSYVQAEFKNNQAGANWVWQYSFDCQDSGFRKDGRCADCPGCGCLGLSGGLQGLVASLESASLVIACQEPTVDWRECTDCQRQIKRSRKCRLLEKQQQKQRLQK